MEKELEVSEEGAPGAPGANIGEVITRVMMNLALVEHVLDVWDGVKNLAANQEQTLDTVKVKRGSKRYEWDMGVLKRTQ